MLFPLLAALFLYTSCVFGAACRPVHSYSLDDNAALKPPTSLRPGVSSNLDDTDPQKPNLPVIAATLTLVSSTTPNAVRIAAPSGLNLTLPWSCSNSRTGIKAGLFSSNKPTSPDQSQSTEFSTSIFRYASLWSEAVSTSPTTTPYYGLPSSAVTLTTSNMPTTTTSSSYMYEFLESSTSQFSIPTLPTTSAVSSTTMPSLSTSYISLTSSSSPSSTGPGTPTATTMEPTTVTSTATSTVVTSSTTSTVSSTSTSVSSITSTFVTSSTSKGYVYTCPRSVATVAPYTLPFYMVMISDDERWNNKPIVLTTEDSTYADDNAFPSESSDFSNADIFALDEQGYLYQPSTNRYAFGSYESSFQGVSWGRMSYLESVYDLPYVRNVSCGIDTANDNEMSCCVAGDTIWLYCDPQVGEDIDPNDITRQGVALTLGQDYGTLFTCFNVTIRAIEAPYFIRPSTTTTSFVRPTTVSTTTSTSSIPTTTSSLTISLGVVSPAATCYQLPTPTASLEANIFSLTIDDGNELDILIYNKDDGSDAGMMSFTVQDQQVVLDYSDPSRLGLQFQDGQTATFDIDGIRIFSADCSTVQVLDSPNLTSELELATFIRRERSLNTPRQKREEENHDIPFIIDIQIDNQCQENSNHIRSPTFSCGPRKCDVTPLQNGEYSALCYFRPFEDVINQCEETLKDDLEILTHGIFKDLTSIGLTEMIEGVVEVMESNPAAVIMGAQAAVLLGPFIAVDLLAAAAVIESAAGILALIAGGLTVLEYVQKTIESIGADKLAATFCKGWYANLNSWSLNIQYTNIIYQEKTLQIFTEAPTTTFTMTPLLDDYSLTTCQPPGDILTNGGFDQIGDLSGAPSPEPWKLGFVNDPAYYLNYECMFGPGCYRLSAFYQSPSNGQATGLIETISTPLVAGAKYKLQFFSKFVSLDVAPNALCRVDVSIGGSGWYWIFKTTTTGWARNTAPDVTPNGHDNQISISMRCGESPQVDSQSVSGVMLIDTISLVPI